MKAQPYGLMEQEQERGITSHLPQPLVSGWEWIVNFRNRINIIDNSGS
jgi:hypothetical protein